VEAVLVSVVLSVKDVEKRFGPLAAARGISVDFTAETTVGIIGANGAGKTTFVNMITGHLAPTSGSIRFQDREIAGLRSRAITRLGIARSFQVAQVFPSLSVFDNMCVAAAVARSSPRILAQPFAPMRSERTVADAEALLELFGIARHREAPAMTLSQGGRKLLDIAMAICGEPRILLLDEPTSGISVEEKYDIMEIVMSALKQRRITILFVEHDMEIVHRFAERVLAFYDGRILADGAPGVVLADPDVQRHVTGSAHGGAGRAGAGHA
jgi:branched-chain amino acid transport system ATP-binding protein